MRVQLSVWKVLPFLRREYNRLFGLDERRANLMKPGSDCAIRDP